jgi:hypothetical protein
VAVPRGAVHRRVGGGGGCALRGHLLTRFRKILQTRDSAKISLVVIGATMLSLWASFSIYALARGDGGAFQRAGTFGIAAAILSAFAAKNHLFDFFQEVKEIESELHANEWRLKEIGISLDGPNQYIQSLEEKRSEINEGIMEIASRMSKYQEVEHPDLFSSFKKLRKRASEMNKSLVDYSTFAIRYFSVRERFFRILASENTTLRRIGVWEVALVTLSTLQTGYGDITVNFISEML